MQRRKEERREKENGSRHFCKPAVFATKIAKNIS